MTTIEVLLQVPEHIQIGLDSGVYERIGGVIREVAGRKIVAWLRDGIDFDTQQPVHLASQALSSLSVTGTLLNFGVSSASLIIILDRLNRLSSEIDKLSQSQQAEHQRNRKVDFTSGLGAAKDALKAKNHNTRMQRAFDAVKGLQTAQQHFLIDSQKSLAENQLLSAQYSLIQAMYALTSRIRCYLEIEEFDLAQDWLKEELNDFEQQTRQLIENWLGSHEAIFLHKDVSDEDVKRFIRIIEWQRGKTFIGILVENLRQDFWNDELIRDQNIDIFSRIRRDTPQFFSDKIKNIPNILTQVEILIENYERLIGFDLEIRSMRLIDSTFQKWRERYPEDKGFAVLYTDTPLDIENSTSQ